MLDQAKIVCFAATANPEGAKKFYTEVLGLTLLEDTPFALVLDANGTTVRIQKVPELTPARYTTLGWDVADLRATLEQLSSKGARFQRYERMNQDDLGIWTAPSGAMVAWFLDPDGNTLSLTQHPKRRTG